MKLVDNQIAASRTRGERCVTSFIAKKYILEKMTFTVGLLYFEKLGHFSGIESLTLLLVGKRS